MKASELLTKWDAVRPVFSQPTYWIRLLRIAAKGAEGMAHTEIMHVGNTVSYDSLRRALRKYVNAGLLTKGPKPSQPNGPITHYFITPKALKLLRVQPEQPNP